MQLERKIKVETLDLGTIGISGIGLKIARLDKIHPVISGNKIYKLHYFIEDFKRSGKDSIASFGGAYSNHLVATAYAAKLLSVPSIGFVRGDQVRNHTLEDCMNYGMKLVFMERDYYSNCSKDFTALSESYPGSYIIPEGGHHPLGSMGAALIANDLSDHQFTDLCSAVGTATTVAGLLQNNQVRVIAVPVLKGMQDLSDRIKFLNSQEPQLFECWDDYHWGGYAKSNTVLFEFMNWLYREYKLETDFIYTSKMMFALFDKIKKGHFPLGSSIMCLHTGGLQGNKSLPPGLLDF